MAIGRECPQGTPTSRSTSPLRKCFQGGRAPIPIPILFNLHKKWFFCLVRPFYNSTERKSVNSNSTNGSKNGNKSILKARRDERVVMDKKTKTKKKGKKKNIVKRHCLNAKPKHE